MRPVFHRLPRQTDDCCAVVLPAALVAVERCPIHLIVRLAYPNPMVSDIVTNVESVLSCSGL